MEVITELRWLCLKCGWLPHEEHNYELTRVNILVASPEEVA